MSVIIDIKHALKAYGKNVIIPNLNLNIAEGEFFTLLGPSGCGKTTLLRMIAGFNTIEGGDFYFNEIKINSLDPSKRNIGMVFQNYAIFPHLSVRENVEFGLKNRDYRKNEIAPQADEFLKLMQIYEYRDRMPENLSGGQQQRVALARALVIKPDVLLMDEPLSNLDAKLRVIMRTELKAIHLKTEATSIFVTHDQSEAMSMADRIVIMKDGKIVQIGTPDDVYFRSASIFVAGFIGTPPANFFNVSCSIKSEVATLENNDFRLDLSLNDFPGIKSYDEKEIVLGVRPEDIEIVPEDDALFMNEILVVEPQGSHQVVAIKMDENIVKIIVPAENKMNYNDKIGLNFNMKRLHLFDLETELRIN